MIFGVAVVFPVVITFGVDSPGVGRAWQGEQLQALRTGEQRPRGNVASEYNSSMAT